jgi:hypothetical protein
MHKFLVGARLRAGDADATDVPPLTEAELEAATVMRWVWILQLHTSTKWTTATNWTPHSVQTTSKLCSKTFRVQMSKQL